MDKTLPNPQDLAKVLEPANESAALLVTVAGVGSKFWGGNEDEDGVSMYESGTVIIVRQDQCDLTVEQVRAMAY